MTNLELIKEYIDAKADYEAQVPRSSSLFTPSVMLTESARRAADRYVNAETNLNLAIEAERKQSLTSAP